MGCKTTLSNNGCVGGFSNGTLSDESCNKYDPQAGGVTVSYVEYPQSPIRQGNYNVPTRGQILSCMKVLPLLVL